VPAVGATTPVPPVLRNVVAVTRAAADALIASTTCLAVLVTAPPASVASVTVIALPSTATLSGVEAPGLTSSAVTSLPPSWPQATDVSTTACAWLAASRPPMMFCWMVDVVEPVYGVAVPTIACALRW
jgi:hypothetical protein